MKRLDLKRVRVFPLASRKSPSASEEIMVEPGSTPAQVDRLNREMIQHCADSVRRAREKGASVMLMALPPTTCEAVACP